MHARFTLPTLILVCAVALTGPVLAKTERVSVTSGGAEKQGDSSAPSISADGRFVAFSSLARLSRKDKSNRSAIYLHDRQTGTTELMSDDRGGDSPVISANGRTVAYRSIEYLPRIRYVDRELPGPPLTASYLYDAFTYARPTESPAISPDGRFISFIFRESPENPAVVVQRDRISRVDLATRALSGNFASGGLTVAEDVPDVGRTVMSASGEVFLFDTTARLVEDDTNSGRDIYLVRASAPDAFVRLSKASGALDIGGATQPVITLDGARAFFISRQPLTSSDRDGRDSIYTFPIQSTVGGGLSHVPTDVEPVALSPQASISGNFLAYLGRSADGQNRARVKNLTGGAETEFPGDAAAEAPALSGDDRVVAFSSKAANLVAGDTNGSADVFVADVPKAPAPRTPPTVTLNQPANGGTVTAGSTVNVAAQAQDAAGPIQLTTFELGGYERLRASGSSITGSFVPEAPGLFVGRARAFNSAWIEGVSSPVQIAVRPQNASAIEITGIEQLTRKDANNGSATFTATARLTNRATFATGPLRFIATVASTPSFYAGAGREEVVPDRGEQVLASFDVEPLAPGATTRVTFSGTTPPTETITDIVDENQFQGVGWTVLATLKNSGFSAPIDTEFVFQTFPRLNENTNLPNGGVPDFGSPEADQTFNPNGLVGLQVIGKAQVGTAATERFTAIAVYNNTSMQCAPEWSVEGADGAASINAHGVLSAANLTAPTTVKVKARFGGRTAKRLVTIKPSVPTVSIRASDPQASEAGDPASFRIVRSFASNQPLDVQYEVRGSANPGEHYTALSGVATIPAGKGGVTVQVAPLQVAGFEGSQSVILKLLPTADYRRGKLRKAAATIADDEPQPPAYPDATISKPGGTPVGATFFAEYESAQGVRVESGPNKTSKFTIGIINRDPDPRNYTVRGGKDAIGVTVRFFSGSEEITSAVQAGTYAVQLAAGETRELILKMRTSTATPIGGSLICPVTVTHAKPEEYDIVSAEVQRVR